MHRSTGLNTVARFCPKSGRSETGGGRLLMVFYSIGCSHWELLRNIALLCERFRKTVQKDGTERRHRRNIERKTAQRKEIERKKLKKATTERSSETFEQSRPVPSFNDKLGGLLEVSCLGQSFTTLDVESSSQSCSCRWSVWSSHCEPRHLRALLKLFSRKLYLFNLYTENLRGRSS